MNTKEEEINMWMTTLRRFKSCTDDEQRKKFERKGSTR